MQSATACRTVRNIPGASTPFVGPWRHPGEPQAQIRRRQGFAGAEEELQYDLYCIKNQSLRLELVVLFETIFVVVSENAAIDHPWMSGFPRCREQRLVPMV